MDTVSTSPQPNELYERDFHAWCTEQAGLLRQRISLLGNDTLDYENLAEEIESLARSDRRAIKSQVRLLLAHLLTWQFQPERRAESWKRTIYNARTAIADLVEESPSLAKLPGEAVGEMYPRAVGDAASETGLPEQSFPDICPFAIEDVFDRAFHPEE